MAHYFDGDPVTAENRKLITYRVNGIDFEFISDTSVFSRHQTDFGTDLMLKAVIEDIKKNKDRITDRSFLDLGCGIGTVGIVIKKCFMKMDVTGVDVNSRAVGLAVENAGYNGVKADFMVSDVLDKIPEDKKFDYIATNPPVRAGKKTVFAFYEQAYAHLENGGSFYCVLQRKQGAPSTASKLTELFGNCETLEIDGGYRVMKSVKDNV
ncbi:MAG: class I SAM-dependent methyltransferase [Clostridiales bacterium]|nr:class I SAM-dependent methyltransferase [Clostridiales bacterium]